MVSSLSAHCMTLLLCVVDLCFVVFLVLCESGETAVLFNKIEELAGGKIQQKEKYNQVVGKKISCRLLGWIDRVVVVVVVV